MSADDDFQWANLIEKEDENWPQEMLLMRDNEPSAQFNFDPRNLFVKHIPESMQDSDLRQLFIEFGPIASAKVIVDPKSLRSKGYGFVRFELCESAKAATKAMHQKHVPPNKRLWVEPALQPTEQPTGSLATAIYIKNLPQSINENTLREMCETFGAVEMCRVLADKGISADHRGLAVVRFALSRCAFAARAALHGKRFDQTESNPAMLDVRMARSPQQPQPRHTPVRSCFRASDPSNKSDHLKFLDEADGGINLFVFYLPEEWNESHVSALFSPFGTITNVKVMRHLHGERANSSKGFGFVKFADEADGLKALEALNGTKVQNKRLKVTLKRSK